MKIYGMKYYCEYGGPYYTDYFSDKEDTKLALYIPGPSALPYLTQSEMVEVDTSEFDLFVVYNIDTGEDCQPINVLGVQPTFEEALEQQVGELPIVPVYHTKPMIALFKWGDSFEGVPTFIR